MRGRGEGLPRLPKIGFWGPTWEAAALDSLLLHVMSGHDRQWWRVLQGTCCDSSYSVMSVLHESWARDGVCLLGHSPLCPDLPCALPCLPPSAPPMYAGAWRCPWMSLARCRQACRSQLPQHTAARRRGRRRPCQQRTSFTWPVGPGRAAAATVATWPGRRHCSRWRAWGKP